MSLEKMVARDDSVIESEELIIDDTYVMNRLYITVMSALFMCGCASTPSYERTFEPHVNPVHGHVVRINANNRYVVLECTVLPFEGEQITLYRDERPVARARVTRHRKSHFVVADLLEGTPMLDDWFRGSTQGHIPQQRK